MNEITGMQKREFRTTERATGLGKSTKTLEGSGGALLCKPSREAGQGKFGGHRCGKPGQEGSLTRQ